MVVVSVGVPIKHFLNVGLDRRGVAGSGLDAFHGYAVNGREDVVDDATIALGVIAVAEPLKLGETRGGKG
jgi:hypothetical protein